MSNPTRWVGIDLHRRRSQIAIIDELGELTLQKRVATGRETITELLGDPGSTHVALEATYGWEWLAELLEDAGFDVHLAHPLRTRAIASARVKTDAIDARTLAHLLRTGLLPEAYIAPPELRDLRELLRHRAMLVHDAHAIKNRVHALLARQGILPSTPTCSARPDASSSRAGAARGPRRRLDSLMALIGDFDREITATTGDRPARKGRRAREAAVPDPRDRALHRDADHRRGRRGRRFPTARHLCAWAGLTPTVRSSDGKARSGTSPARAPEPALGAVRGRQHITHRRRAAARHVRADRQTPRRKIARGRGRPPDPHPLLLRAQGRRDPLPHHPPRRQRGTGRGRMTNASPPQACAQHQGARCMLGRARSCVWPPAHREQDGRRLD